MATMNGQVPRTLAGSAIVPRSPPRTLRASAAMLSVLLLLPLSGGMQALAADHPVTGARSFTATVIADDYDTYRVTAPAGKQIKVTFTVTSPGEVDVYVFDQAQMNDYEN